MHEMTIPMKMLFSFHSFHNMCSSKAQGRQLYKKQHTPTQMAVGMEAWLVFSWWVMAFALQSAKYLFFLYFKQIHSATLIEIG
jgi:hypothetical protein